MVKQLYWEDVNVGDEITPLLKIATTQTLVKWAAASLDFYPIHYEDTFARSSGLERPIIHGALKRAWLIQALTNWIGEQGTLNKFLCQYRAMDYPRLIKTATSRSAEPQEGDTCWCKGKVTNKYIENDNHYVDCDIWIENGKGEVTTPGKATVSLPSKSE